MKTIKHGIEQGTWLMPVIVGLVMMAAPLTGCHSFRSDTVRDLIGREGQKIDSAQVNSAAIEKETEARIIAMKESLKDLNDRFVGLQQAEAAHSLVFKSYQNLNTKREQDAHAAAYLLGMVYLDEYEGLNKAIMDQFDEDFCALQALAARLGDSWKAIGDLHGAIDRFAHASAFASTDPTFVDAVLAAVPGSSGRVTQVLDRSRMVNDALEEALGLAFLKGHGLERVKAVNTDLLGLLERLSPQPK
jgi:hypothetical protein